MISHEPFTPAREAARTSITQISTKALFGYSDYVLAVPSTSIGSDIIILYGENGSGKTTILELLFHLLSPGRKAGHRNAIARIPFKSFQVSLSDGTTITATRAGDRITGSYALILERRGDRIANCMFDPETPGQFSPPGGEKEFLGFVEGLGFTIHLLSADRRMTNDRIDVSQVENEQLALFETFTDTMVAEHLGRTRRHRGKPPVHSLNPEFALKRAQEWIQQQAVRGTNVGTENANSIYTEIVKRLTNPYVSLRSEESNGGGDLIPTLEKISTRTEVFAKYGFTPPFSAGELITAVQSIDSHQRGLVKSILEPFMTSMTARLDALDELQRVTSTFVGHLNSFFRNKSITFDVTEGFTVKGPTGHRLEPYWLSSGEQQLLVLLCSTLTARDKPSIFIIDEPELSLNVKWQRQLIDALTEIVTGANVQFIFATHSLEIISQHRDKVLVLQPTETGALENRGAKDPR